ncbi:7532_t:CDS:2 [Funneliformis mosseae]|uniref:7532_t:CDS:1 n=1 Tax=Funneliformis mosseae TaxID=27381 RepID=A0A9N9CV37_FUNMO|nr:7532_t:CDS:2 [Funneliformis mosseae]
MSFDNIVAAVQRLYKLSVDEKDNLYQQAILSPFLLTSLTSSLKVRIPRRKLSGILIVDSIPPNDKLWDRARDHGWEVETYASNKEKRFALKLVYGKLENRNIGSGEKGPDFTNNKHNLETHGNIIKS